MPESLVQAIVASQAFHSGTALLEELKRAKVEALIMWAGGGCNHPKVWVMTGQNFHITTCHDKISVSGQIVLYPKDLAGAPKRPRAAN